MKKILLVAAALMTLVACGNKKTAENALSGRLHPEWIYNTVVYEVNIRQFSPEASFNGVTAQLPRLKTLGVDVL